MCITFLYRTLLFESKVNAREGLSTEKETIFNTKDDIKASKQLVISNNIIHTFHKNIIKILN